MGEESISYFHPHTGKKFEKGPSHGEHERLVFATGVVSIQLLSLASREITTSTTQRVEPFGYVSIQLLSLASRESRSEAGVQVSPRVSIQLISLASRENERVNFSRLQIPGFHSIDLSSE